MCSVVFSSQFHYRTYTPVPLDTAGNGFQSTFSISGFEAFTAKSTFTLGTNSAIVNQGFEAALFAIWCADQAAAPHISSLTCRPSQVRAELPHQGF